MPKTLFISDLHLSAERPALVEAFHAFARGPAREAAAALRPGRPVRCLAGRRSAPRSARCRRRRRLRRAGALRHAGLSPARQPRLSDRTAFCRCERRDPARGRRRARRAWHAHADHARRPVVHRRRRLPALPRVLAEPRAPPPRSRPAIFSAACDRGDLERAQPAGDRSQAGEDHGRQRRGRRRGAA